MKKLLITITTIYTIVLPPALGAYKCVYLDNDTRCSAKSHTSSDWSATCDEIEISGVAFCGSDGGDIAGEVNASETSTDNKYCWCKMVSPAVSDWQFERQFSSASDCLTTCTTACSGILSINTDWLTD